MEIQYVGPSLAVEVGEAPGIVAKRNAPTHFPDAVARKLLQQPDNWRKAEKTTPAPKAQNGDSK